MRFILWLVAACAALYGGYWFVGSRALMAGADNALAEMRAAQLGDYAGFDLGGFPSRFDVTLTEPELTSADHGLAWSAPEIKLYALAYKPQHIIAVMPETQALRIGGQTVSMTSDDLTASAVFGLDPSLPLDHGQTVGKNVGLVSDFGWGFGAEEVRAAIRQGADPLSQEIGVEVTGMTLSGAPARLITTGNALPDRGERLYLDARLDLSAPLDRKLAERPLRILGTEIRSLTLEWGPVRLNGRGMLKISPRGEPEGRLELGVENWRAALRLANALGLLRPETAPTVERALESLALMGGNADRLAMPLVFKSGRMSLGPIPLGPAPRF